MGQRIFFHRHCFKLVVHVAVIVQRRFQTSAGSPTNTIQLPTADTFLFPVLKAGFKRIIVRIKVFFTGNFEIIDISHTVLRTRLNDKPHALAAHVRISGIAFCPGKIGKFGAGDVLHRFEDIFLIIIISSQCEGHGLFDGSRFVLEGKNHGISGFQFGHHDRLLHERVTCHFGHTVFPDSIHGIRRPVFQGARESIVVGIDAGRGNLEFIQVSAFADTAVHFAVALHDNNLAVGAALIVHHGIEDLYFALRNRDKTIRKLIHFTVYNQYNIDRRTRIR